MSKPMDLTEEAIAGYRSTCNSDGTPQKNPYLATSPSAMAWKVGAFLARTGRSEPSDVRMGRGYQVRVRDMLYAINERGEISRVH